MIYDTLENAAFYPCGEAFAKAIEFVKSVNENTPLGKHEIDGDTVYANVMEYETSDTEPAKYEIHRKYVDLQAVVIGSEALFFRSADGLAVETPYDAEGDYGFVAVGEKGSEMALQLYPGNFALLFPQDAHMGRGISCKGVSQLKKVVVKIALDAFNK